MNVKNLLNELSNLFFPDCCPVCSTRLLPSEQGVCLQCLHALPKTNNFMEPDNLAETLLAGRFPFERAATFCVYSRGGVLQPLIHQLKYNNKREIGVLLGKLFGKDLTGSEFILPIDLIIPVPLHPQKQKERGFNQAETIAHGLSEATSIPVSSGNLVRSIFNPTQTQRTKTQRWENVKGIFDLLHPSLYAGKHILLVDDIITTGSTLEACAHALLKSPGIKISVATLGEVF
jgi:ComF family protein